MSQLPHGNTQSREGQLEQEQQEQEHLNMNPRAYTNKQAQKHIQIH